MTISCKRGRSLQPGGAGRPSIGLAAGLLSERRAPDRLRCIRIGEVANAWAGTVAIAFLDAETTAGSTAVLEATTRSSYAHDAAKL